MKTLLTLSVLLLATGAYSQEKEETQPIQNKTVQPAPNVKRGIVLGTDVKRRKLVKPSTVVIETPAPKEVSSEAEKKD